MLSLSFYFFFCIIWDETVLWFTPSYWLPDLFWEDGSRGKLCVTSLLLAWVEFWLFCICSCLDFWHSFLIVHSCRDTLSLSSSLSLSTGNLGAYFGQMNTDRDFFLSIWGCLLSSSKLVITTSDSLKRFVFSFLSVMGSNSISFIFSTSGLIFSPSGFNTCSFLKVWYPKLFEWSWLDWMGAW